ncbi:hypothetical protein Salat_1704100 [Sesamum alatum]|uniref:Uncharacterized protein n=1 Tax=Sesamum alatum TaxID=300844 RepID=A0AAE2CK35_9LAMI|nr:hypothetical protein Salat_1704100 [Sesamum alatum]
MRREAIVVSSIRIHTVIDEYNLQPPFHFVFRIIISGSLDLRIFRTVRCEISYERDDRVVPSLSHAAGMPVQCVVPFLHTARAGKLDWIVRVRSVGEPTVDVPAWCEDGALWLVLNELLSDFAAPWYGCQLLIRWIDQHLPPRFLSLVLLFSNGEQHQIGLDTSGDDDKEDDDEEYENEPQLGVVKGNAARPSRDGDDKKSLTKRSRVV